MADPRGHRNFLHQMACGIPATHTHTHTHSTLTLSVQYEFIASTFNKQWQQYFTDIQFQSPHTLGLTSIILDECGSASFPIHSPFHIHPLTPSHNVLNIQEKGWQWRKMSGGKVHSMRGNWCRVCAEDINWTSSFLQSPTDSRGSYSRVHSSTWLTHFFLTQLYARFVPKQEGSTHSTDKTVCVPLLVQCCDELFTDRMTATSASRSKQLIIVVAAAAQFTSHTPSLLNTSSLAHLN